MKYKFKSTFMLFEVIVFKTFLLPDFFFDAGWDVLSPSRAIEKKCLGREVVISFCLTGGVSGRTFFIF